MCSLMMIESAIFACFFRTKMEGWMGQSPFYMLLNGMYTISRRRS